MTPNFLHLKGTEDAVVAPFRESCGRPDLYIEVTPESNGWVTLSVDCDYLDTDKWLSLGQHMDLIYESYSTSTRMGELVVIRNGKLVRHFLHQEPDEWNEEERLDIGSLPCETQTPLQSWHDVCRYVDDWHWLEDA